MRHEATTVYSTAYERRAAFTHGRFAFSRCLYYATKPDIARFLKRPTSLGDSSQPGLCCPDRSQRYQRLPPRRIRLSQARFITTQDSKAPARWRQSRSAASHLTPNSACLWQTHFVVDFGSGSRGVPRARLDRAASQHRTDPPGTATVGSGLVGWQRAKHWITSTSPDPEYERKKRGATI